MTLHQEAPFRGVLRARRTHSDPVALVGADTRWPLKSSRPPNDQRNQRRSKPARATSFLTKKVDTSKTPTITTCRRSLGPMWLAKAGLAWSGEWSSDDGGPRRSDLQQRARRCGVSFRLSGISRRAERLHAAGRQYPCEMSWRKSSVALTRMAATASRGHQRAGSSSRIYRDLAHAAGRISGQHWHRPPWRASNDLGEGTAGLGGESAPASATSDGLKLGKWGIPVHGDVRLPAGHAETAWMDSNVSTVEGWLA